MRLPSTPILAALLFATSLLGPGAGRLVAQADSAPAQPTIPRWHVGIAADAGQPTGDFRRNARRAGGAHGHVRLRLDQYGILSLRLEGGYLNYGHENQRMCLASTPGCRVAVRVITANGILSGGAGPELSLPIGRVRAFGYALAGVSRLATVSGLGGGLLPDFVAADENFGDGGFAWSTGGGLSVPLRSGFALDLGVSYQGNGQRDYLVKGGVTDRPDGSLDFDVKRSHANVFTYRIGFSTAIVRKPKK